MQYKLLKKNHLDFVKIKYFICFTVFANIFGNIFLSEKKNTISFKIVLYETVVLQEKVIADPKKKKKHHSSAQFHFILRGVILKFRSKKLKKNNKII